MKSDETNSPWRTLSSRKIYDNSWISVREDVVIRPDGREGIYGVVSFRNIAVGVLAIEEEYLYLVGQHRYPLGEYSWEIPEGGCAGDEEPLDAAQRELEEETGLRAEKWEKLGEAYLSNSVTDERAIWFLATGLIQGKSRPDGTEVLSVRRVTIDEAMRMSLSGEITDALSLLAIMRFQLERFAAKRTLEARERTGKLLTVERADS